MCVSRLDEWAKFREFGPCESKFLFEGVVEFVVIRELFLCFFLKVPGIGLFNAAENVCDIFCTVAPADYVSIFSEDIVLKRGAE